MASNALLAEIQKGRSLKKTTTNDRSVPLVGPNQSRSASGGGLGSVSTPVISSAPLPGGGGAPQLGGLFAGGVPKLKPSGSSAPGKAPSLAKPPGVPKRENGSPAVPPARAPPPPSRPPPPPARPPPAPSVQAPSVPSRPGLPPVTVERRPSPSPTPISSAPPLPPARPPPILPNRTPPPPSNSTSSSLALAPPPIPNRSSQIPTREPPSLLNRAALPPPIPSRTSTPPTPVGRSVSSYNSPVVLAAPSLPNRAQDVPSRKVPPPPPAATPSGGMRSTAALPPSLPSRVAPPPPPRPASAAPMSAGSPSARGVLPPPSGRKGNDESGLAPSMRLRAASIGERPQAGLSIPLPAPARQRAVSSVIVERPPRAKNPTPPLTSGSLTFPIEGFPPPRAFSGQRREYGSGGARGSGFNLSAL